MTSPKERRRSPRVENNVPLKISGEDFDIVTESKNLSVSGAYCTVDQYLEPMTKLKIQLLLPFRKKNALTTRKISCQGVVVRTQAHAQDKNFSIAIYFNEVEAKAHKLIAEYVAGLLKESPGIESP